MTLESGVLESGRSVTISSGSGGPADVTVDSDFENEGQITLTGDTASGSYAALRVRTSGGGTLTNHGTITAEEPDGENVLAFELNNASSGVVNIDQSTSLGSTGGSGGEEHVINDGTLYIAPAATLGIYGTRFTLAGGTLEVDGDLQPQSGLKFEHTGGTLDLSGSSSKTINLFVNDLTLTGGSLSVPTTFDIRSSSEVFVGSGYAAAGDFELEFNDYIVANVTLESGVLESGRSVTISSGSGGPADVTVDSDFTNEGQITLTGDMASGSYAALRVKDGNSGGNARQPRDDHRRGARRRERPRIRAQQRFLGRRQHRPIHLAGVHRRKRRRGARKLRGHHSEWRDSLAVR